MRIADFGLATYLTEEEKILYLRCGSPGYVAPELLDDRGYDTQADVFSAGVIMYVMLTGRPLFRGDNVNEILEKNKSCKLEFPAKYWDHISPDAKSLAEGMLKGDPHERLTAAQALKHEWFTSATVETDKVIQRDEEFKFRDEADGEKASYNLLVTCTPVMAGRKLQNVAPESPFLTSVNLANVNNTPILRKVTIDDGKNRQQVQIGGITIIRPNQMVSRAEEAKEQAANKLGLPQILPFKKFGAKAGEE